MLLCSITACSGGGGSNLCDVNADCDSGFCKADGTCGPSSTDDGGAGDDTQPDGNTDLCSPNADGMITQAELPLRAGKMARFRVATDATFDTAGTTTGGMRTWDLSGALSGDTDEPITLDAPGTAYWAADFPTASYATPISASSDLLGIFHVDATAVTLLGVVSPTAGSSGTNVSYDPPATILSLPVTSGGHWKSTSNVVGTYQGSYVNYDETYESNVDQTGTMKTPYGSFPVMRIATTLDQTGIVFPYTKFGGYHSFAWTAECFGSVANVTSQSLEDSTEFNDPSEVKRLIP
jgi:hypothetical protein